MSEDYAEGFYYKADSFHDAASILRRLTDFPYSSDWMQEGHPDPDHPGFKGDPVWIIEITVRRASSG